MAVDPTAAAVAAAVADAHRREWAFVLAATVRVTRDLDLAEECVQDAYARALDTWGAAGIPARPGAWLTTVARRRALDLLRRERPSGAPAAAGRRPALAPRPDAAADELAMPELPARTGRAARPVQLADPAMPDDRLRLIFTCCHPALAADAQVALTLRLLCGLTTAEVARAFLVSEPTMAARITRAKKKIAAARIPYRVPPAAELPARIEAVLTVVHLLFTTGHTAPAGDDLVRGDLVERALDLARMLRVLLPGHGEVAGLLALILLTDARRGARVDAGRAGCSCSPTRTARSGTGPRSPRALPWSARRCAGRPGPVRAAGGDRGRPRRGAALRRHRLAADRRAVRPALRRWPSPVVALNRAVAVGFADGPAEGLAALDALAASRSWPVTATCPPPGRTSCAASADPRGAAGVRGGAAADRQRRRARLPGRAPGSARLLTEPPPAR